MTAYQTEEEQVEALKKWWKENGRSTVIGLLLGLGGVLGWQAWTQQQQSTAERAAEQFAQLTMSSDTGNGDSAIKQAELLISEFKGSPYAVFAALDLARLHLQRGDVAAARKQLEWTLVNSDEQPLQQIARLRLARLLLHEGNVDGAAKLVDGAPVDSFAGEFAQLKGDIALARGDRQGAREAYQAALARDVSSADVVQMKLDDLAVSTPTP